MPGLSVLLDDELQQMRPPLRTPRSRLLSRAVLTNAITADTQIKTLVNTYWPAGAED